MQRSTPGETASPAGSPVELRPATRAWRAGWMIGASIGVVLIIVMILLPSTRTSQAARSHSYMPPETLVDVSGPRQIMIAPASPLARNLQIVEVTKQSVSHPRLTVTGSVVARMRGGAEPIETRWQFASAEVASTYADWLKTSIDIDFNQKQLTTTRNLSQAQIERYETIVARLKPLSSEGDVPRKDFLTAEADLLQARLQGQKDVFDAESMLRLSQRQKSSLERKLSQAGIEPTALAGGREGMVLVSANVPEAKISLVSVGQACEVRFFGLPGKVYPAHVEELGSVLSTERRTLRVLFDLNDPDDQLKPGMFAEIGLGTDPRDAILIPASAVVHVNRTDYVFRKIGDDKHYEVVEVEVGEAPGETVEVLNGLQVGDRIAGNEAVLLKPLAIRSLAD